MKGSIIKSGKMALFMLFCMILVGCGDNGEDQMESVILEEGRQAVDQNALLEEPESSPSLRRRGTKKAAPTTKRGGCAASLIRKER